MELKISNLYPPNWDLISLAFPNAKDTRTIFCFGDTIYNPFQINITPDLEVHEVVHSKRQGNDPAMWWVKYVQNKEFRFEEEKIAYATQYKFAVDKIGSSKLTDWVLEKVSEALSSELYNLGISYGEAKSKIRNYAKQL